MAIFRFITSKAQRRECAAVKELLQGPQTKEDKAKYRQTIAKIAAAAHAGNRTNQNEH